MFGRLTIRERLYLRPIIGRWIPCPPEPIPERWTVLVRHPAMGVYWRDPYGLRDGSTVWGPPNKAWRFVSEPVAREMVERELGVPVVYRHYRLPD